MTTKSEECPDCQGQGGEFDGDWMETCRTCFGCGYVDYTDVYEDAHPITCVLGVPPTSYCLFGRRVRDGSAVSSSIPHGEKDLARLIQSSAYVPVKPVERHPKGTCGGECGSCKPTPCGDSFCFSSCDMCAWAVPVKEVKS